MDELITRCGLPEDMLTPTMVSHMGVLESALLAIDEGTATKFIVTKANSYTHSTYTEFLENVKDFLVKLATHVLTLLSDYHMNNAKLLNKYQELILTHFDRIKGPLYHECYTYPNPNIPKLVRAASVEADVMRLQKLITQGVGPERVSFFVDEMLSRFGEEVTGYVIDPYDIPGTVKANLEENYRGVKQLIPLDRESLKEWITSLQSYKADKAEIEATRKAILSEYEVLRDVHKKATAKPPDIDKDEKLLDRMLNPERLDFVVSERSRYSDIHIQMMRLFNGYIRIYQKAYVAKLELMEERIADRRNTIIEIFQRTNLMATLSQKNPKGSVIDFTPKLRG